MRERPILFSGPLVKALLAGTKTQTRRLCKPELAAELTRDGWPNVSPLAIAYVAERCPYGVPGDKLWVRETWAWSGDKLVPEPGRIAAGEVWFQADGLHTSPAIRWRPSIHMFRWASRITLEVTEVRVQRLQDISEEDAKAEGVSADDLGSHRLAFEYLWGKMVRELSEAPVSGEQRPCRSCGAPLLWVVSATGARMPLDAKPEKRVVLDDAGAVGRVVDTYVSHFATCPNAAQHRKAKN